jgi:hypothetical protein
MGRVLLVTHQNVANPLPLFVEFIVNMENRRPRISKDRIHPQLNESFDQYPRP